LKYAVSGVRMAKVGKPGDIGVKAAWAGEFMGDAWLFRLQLVPLLRVHGAVVVVGVVAFEESIVCLRSSCSDEKEVTS